MKSKYEVFMKVKSVKNPWNFSAPAYDKRSSNAVNAGTQQGVGKVQPVGSQTYTSKGPIPFGRISTLKDDQIG